KLLHPTSTLFPYTTLFRSIKEILFPKRDVNQQNSNQKSKSTGQNNSVFHLFYGNRSTLNGSIRTNSGFVISSFDSVSVIVGKIRSEEHTSELQSRENLVCR